MTSYERTPKGGKRTKQWNYPAYEEYTGVTWSNPGTSYVEPSAGLRMKIDFDKIPATKIKLMIRAKDSEDGGDVELYDFTNSQQLAEITNLGSGAVTWHDSGWETLPSNVQGHSAIEIGIRHKGSSGTEDMTYSRIHYVLGCD